MVRHASKGVAFTPAFSVHRYPPAVWGEEEEDEEDVEWDDEGYEDEDPELAEEQEERERASQRGSTVAGPSVPMSMEPDDGMSWEDGAVQDVQDQARVQMAAEAEAERFRLQQQQELVLAQQQEQQRLQQQQQLEQQQRELQAQSLRKQSSREQLGTVDASDPLAKTLDPAQAMETRKISMTPPIARVDELRPAQQQPQSSPTGSGHSATSTLARRQSDERKRVREETEALDDAARKKVNINPNDKPKAGPVSSATSKPNGGAKLRKERDSTDDESGKDKKKKSGERARKQGCR